MFLFKKIVGPLFYPLSLCLLVLLLGLFLLLFRRFQRMGKTVVLLVIRLPYLNSVWNLVFDACDLALTGDLIMD